MKVKSVKVKVVGREDSTEALEMNWYDMPGALDGFENNPAFLEKMKIDEVDENPDHKTVSAKKPSGKQRECSWVRKRSYKKRLVRRFLSVNPDKVYTKEDGNTYMHNCLYFCRPLWHEGDFHDPNVDYIFNPYSHVYLSPRGDIRKWNGTIYGGSTRAFFLGTKDSWASRITNRRIRHQPIEDVNHSYSFYKKMFFEKAHVY